MGESGARGRQMADPPDKKLSQEEQEVIRLSLDGQPDRFRELVTRYQKGVLSLCFRMVGRYHEAEDLAQQSFVDAFAKLKRFDLERPFWPWLCRIAVNNCKDFLKSRKRLEVPSALEPSSQDALQPVTWDNPEAAQVRKERAEMLHRALLRLPVAYRTVLVLKDIEDLPYAEIRKILNLPVTTLKIRVVRARQKLADVVDAMTARLRQGKRNGDAT